ncbi:hypothetical protein TNCT_96561 [Trichonephila clavata]|uniref:Uncharacterized protein n=1 Tax=Trichonephila clavata TaxID=2740835 RepID=A0A8X6J3Q1_TRICU|nr:hypothetical protein TNCT_96561 [Trichonephila clavata]
MGGQVAKSITPETQRNPFNHGSVMSLFRVKFPEVFPLICALSREEPPKGAVLSIFVNYSRAFSLVTLLVSAGNSTVEAVSYYFTMALNTTDIG